MPHFISTPPPGPSANPYAQMPSQTPTPQPGQVHTGIPSLPHGRYISFLGIYQNIANPYAQMPSQTPTPQPGQVHTGIPSLPPNILALLQQSQGQHGQGSAPQQMQSQYGMPPLPPQSMMSPPMKPDNFVPPTANKDRKTPESAPAALSIHPQPTSKAIKPAQFHSTFGHVSRCDSAVTVIDSLSSRSSAFSSTITPDTSASSIPSRDHIPSTGMRVHGKDISPPITVLHSNDLNSALECLSLSNCFGGGGVLSRLWAKHEQEGGEVWGVDIEVKFTSSATNFKILDPLAAKQWAIKLATEAAVSVLSVDSIIMSKPAGRNPTHTYSILRYLSPTRTLRNRLHAASSKLLFSFVVLAKDQTQFTHLLVDPDLFRCLVSLNIYT
ncbi:uncharacterized protein F5891DRAFT_1244384 [Suillus fuscotomentosus]|uniref:Uncharacterized protein n=1 Tax=Suillus fuscotomentosus TaxID=1912939 RepID=A0AAD4EHD1_9AGAM|nr:uncharacterized protein F5891DRAFT_1244384 [Suillus fuscotomentosus]KAG1906265.1 hypothetical protein F5891DRAFT_1244384 [Suillus fuscotomentosus]